VDCWTSGTVCYMSRNPSEKRTHVPEFSLTPLLLRDLEGLSDFTDDPSLLGHDGVSGQVVLLFRMIVLHSTSWSSSQ